MTGPLGGSRASGSERMSFVFISPLTRTIFESSLGGKFGAYLKWAGYDGIAIQGKTSSPFHLHIEREKAELRDAEKYWGKGASETEQAIKKDVGDPSVRVADIGIAGENLVYFANVMHETRTAGRGGAGESLVNVGSAVMSVISPIVAPAWNTISNTIHTLSTAFGMRHLYRHA